MTLHSLWKQSLGWGVSLAMILSSGEVLRAQSTVTRHNPSPLAQQIQFKWPTPPKDPGAPKGRRRGGAQRCSLTGQNGLDLNHIPAHQPFKFPVIIALVPQTPAGQVWGLTHATHPTLWFYVNPANVSPLSITFVLQDQQEEEIYRKRLLVTAQEDGIVRVALPPTIDALALGQRYTWTAWFTDCKDHITGRIYRTAAQEQALSMTPVNLDRVSLKATHGVWHDALTDLAILRQQDPDNPNYRRAWDRLLQQVDLDSIAPEPLLPCCDPAL